MSPIFILFSCSVIFVLVPILQWCCWCSHFLVSDMYADTNQACFYDEDYAQYLHYIVKILIWFFLTIVIPHHFVLILHYCKFFMCCSFQLMPTHTAFTTLIVLNKKCLVGAFIDSAKSSSRLYLFYLHTNISSLVGSQIFYRVFIYWHDPKSSISYYLQYYVSGLGQHTIILQGYRREVCLWNYIGSLGVTWIPKSGIVCFHLLMYVF